MMAVYVHELRRGPVQQAHGLDGNFVSNEACTRMRNVRNLQVCLRTSLSSLASYLVSNQRFS